MSALTFRGGVKPHGEKARSSGVAIAPLAAPTEIVIPLSQHIGAPARACVAPGDEVLMGQVLGEPGGFVSAPVHASVSGKVKAIEPRPGQQGVPTECVVIENDGQDRASEVEGLGDGWAAADPKEIKDRVAKAGLVGMGGAAFPTHVKLSPPPAKPIDAVILNGAECEPYLTADHRIMLERPADVLAGLAIVRHVLGAKRAVIGVEENKPDAIEKLREAAAGSGVEILVLAKKYPQGAEKQLIDAILGREVPSGGLPLDVGCVVQNVGTAAAIADAVIRGKLLYERVVTVTGAPVARPANLLVRVGTPVAAAIEACGGDLANTAKLVLGGPLMGLAQHATGAPVTKGTSGILLLGPREVDARPPAPCIRCGRCVGACPIHLVPTEIGNLAVRGLLEDTERADALDCIECGCCAFGCPSRIPLVQQIRLGKAGILAARRKKGQG
ncbi:MAG TPA: electron transport complex subunit RsxC [Polyangia bacterium]|nr:electron transport complex subunit RsxC [Polyangia bacterium]